ncbi:MAG: hypothetical protein IT380_21840 [Myxococcales bacterium]|nr:hypothetical protein [Myxococcales bacterium]
MRLGLAAVLLLALSACASKELLDAEAELAATRARLAALEKRRSELTAKQQARRVSRAALAQQADDAELARVRLLAALTALDEGKVPDHLLLDEAMRAKDPTLDALAAQVVQRQLPCVDEAGEPPAEQTWYGGCAAPPPEDACEGVEVRVRQRFEWDCSELIARAGFPTAAFCTAVAEWDSRVVPDLSGASDRIVGQLIRIAFEKDGHLFVRDWPPPSVDLYEPPNTLALEACAATNEAEQCTRRCDESFGRVGCGPDGGEGEYEESDGEEVENPELPAAREAAARAEAEAQRAREELEYQQCLDTCRGDDDAEHPPMLELLNFTFTTSPAPGVFALQARHLLADSEEVPDQLRTLVLHHPDFVTSAQGTLSAPAEDTVKELVELLDVVDLEVVPEGASVLVAGLDRNQLVAVRAWLDGKQAPAAVDAEEACRLLEERPKARKSLVEACRRLPASKADAGTSSAADGGAP